MPITALFAGLLAPLYIVLALRVIGLRRSAGVALGDGGDPWLTRRMRVHANFAEYAPFTLLLMGLAESLHASHSTRQADVSWQGGCCMPWGSPKRTRSS
jgi:uncharacterized membrane protein YecN with MAPEG domain